MYIQPGIMFPHHFVYIGDIKSAYQHSHCRCCCCCSYMEPAYASLQLISEGRKLLMLDRLEALPVMCPVHILHGVQVSAHMPCCSLVQRNRRMLHDCRLSVC